MEQTKIVQGPQIPTGLMRTIPVKQKQGYLRKRAYTDAHPSQNFTVSGSKPWEDSNWYRRYMNTIVQNCAKHTAEYKK